MEAMRVRLEITSLPPSSSMHRFVVLVCEDEGGAERAFTVARSVRAAMSGMS